jgi:hypothetical protein
MTSVEMAYEWKITYESMASGTAPGYTPREVSVLLTQAQEEIVLEVAQQGLDSSDYARTVLSNLLTPYPTNIVATLATDIFGNVNSTRAWKFVVPRTATLEFFYPAVEFATTGSGATAHERACKPIDYNSYYTSISNPFANPYVDLYWRLYDGDHITIITDGTALTAPYIKGLYIKKPSPIITSVATPAFTIDGITNTAGLKNCILNEISHREIVYRAAKKAFAAMKDQVGYQIQNVEEQN